MLNIALDRLAFIVEKAREFDVEVAGENDGGSNPADDGVQDILLDTPDNPTAEELRDAITGLNQDEREELVALMWVGRGDYEPEEWKDAVAQVRVDASTPISDYLMGTPLLADYLEEGISLLGLSLEDEEMGRL